MKHWALLLVCLCLSGCFATSHGFGKGDGAPGHQVDVSQIANPIPRVLPKSKYGNPATYEVQGYRYHVMDSAKGYHARGIASWYGTKFHNKRTSSGEPYDMYAMTAAHKSLPLPSFVRVTNLKNGRQVIVKVNDRGPFIGNRLIDLSYVAAKKLGITGKGTGLVEVDAIDLQHPEQSPEPKLDLTHKPELYLQVGAFSSRLNAERLATRLRQLTKQTVHITPGRSQQRAVYRVQVGPLASVNQSDRVYATIKHAGFGDAIAVVN